MNRVRSKRIASLISTLLVFSWNLLPSLSDAGQNAYDFSIVIQPQNDGVSDEITGDITVVLRKALPVIMPVHVVSQQITNEVLAYHQRDGVAESAGKESASEMLSRAKEHYFQLQYDEALAEASRAVDLLFSGDLADNGSLLQDALLTQAIVAKAADKPALAKDSFDRAVHLNPFYLIDRKLFSPSIVEMFEKSRSELMRGAKGSLSVQTDPEAAEVFLNGILQGVTPLDLPQIPAGSYILSIKTNKYQPVSKTITITDGQRIVMNEKLMWIKTQEGKKSTQIQNAKAEIEEGLRIADNLKTDKAVIIDCDESGRGGTIYARMVDRQFRAAHRPIIVEYAAKEERAQAIADLAQTLANLARINLLSDPMKYLDPDGLGDPILLAGKKREIYKRPIFWGAIGTAAAGAIVGGIMAAMSGGDSPRTGSVAVQFK